VHTHDYPTAHENHHLQPLSRGGWNDPSNMIWLCANGHGDVHFFLDLIEKCKGPERVPFRLAKHYSPAIRRTAAAGWSRYAAAFLAGDYARHAALWSTSGQPREGMPVGMPTYQAATSRSELALLLRVAEVSRDPVSDLRALLSPGVER
jgi:hypothetical protein